MNQSKLDKLAGYLIFLGVLAIVAVVCWYFRSVLVYLVLSLVVALISKPLVWTLRKVRIRGKSAPDWVLSLVAIFIVIFGAILIVLQVIPVVASIVNDAALFNDTQSLDNTISESVNGWVRSTIPSVGEDYDAIGALLHYLKETTSDFSVTGLLGSVASVVVDLAIGIFAVIFISFFFVKDNKLFSNIVAALVPDRIEDSAVEAVKDIEFLLSRYFLGILLEMLCVATFNFLGLWLIARININYALGIAFIAGILNIIPYVGPLIGEITGTLLCIVLKLGAGTGLDVNVWVLAAIVLIIMLSVQLIDNFVLQPIIYSTSIQSTPLEIFIIILLAGHIGGIIGMLAAIPTYTIIRVIAGRFFYHKKFVQRLMPDMANLHRPKNEELKSEN